MALAGNKVNNHNSIEAKRKIGWFISKKKKDYGNRIIREKTISYLKKKVLTQKKKSTEKINEK